MACDATCFCGSCLKKVRMFCPRTQRRGRRSCPHRHRIRTGLFEPKSPLRGNGIFTRRDKEAETALEIQGRRCRDKISLGNPADSGLIAGFREISVRTRMRGGPGGLKLSTRASRPQLSLVRPCGRAIIRSSLRLNQVHPTGHVGLRSRLNAVGTTLRIVSLVLLFLPCLFIAIAFWWDVGPSAPHEDTAIIHSWYAARLLSISTG